MSNNAKQWGIIEGYASTFGNIDLEGDIMHRTAFDQTIEQSQYYPLLYCHRDNIQLGHTVINTDSHGVIMRGYIDLSSIANQLIFERIQNAELSGLSVGFVSRAELDNREAGGNRLIQNIDLKEISIVYQPANPLATISNSYISDIVPEQIGARANDNIISLIELINQDLEDIANG